MLGMTRVAAGPTAARSAERRDQPMRPTLDRRHARERRVHEKNPAGADTKLLKLRRQFVNRGHRTVIISFNSGMVLKSGAGGMDLK